jgi:hypothetical protein
MKQDRIIPVSRCQVIEIIVTQFCGHWSPAGVTRCVHFREPKALEHGSAVKHMYMAKWP